MDIQVQHTSVGIQVGGHPDMDIHVGGQPNLVVEAGGHVNVDIQLGGQPGVEILFDSFQIDTELTLTSDNAIANNVVTAEFNRVDTQLTKVDEALTLLRAGVDTEGSVDNKIRTALSWGRLEDY